ncbi:hypothetical protein N9N67_06930 [Bacteriovoracaceae bacterium]|nr:hypothetical protein [Bacteriovoracaceae bacterium]
MLEKQSIIIIYYSFILVTCFTQMTNIHALEAEGKSEVVTLETENKGLKKENKINQSHKFVSQQLMRLTNWFDSFFGNKKYLLEQNGSRIRFFNTTNKFEKNEMTNDNGYRVSLRFPNLENLLQINIERRGEEESGATPTPETRLTTENVRDEGAVRASVSALYRKSKKLDFKFTAGYKFEIPPFPFLNFRVSLEDKIFTKWKYRFISSSFWEEPIGQGQSFSYDFDRKITKDTLFRFVNEYSWFKEPMIENFSHGPSLFHRLNQKNALSYNFRAKFNQKWKDRADQYAASIVYRHNIFKEWFFYELVPLIQYNQVENYVAKHGISIKFEIAIGDY